MSSSNWVTFFKDAGVESSVAMTYATTFVQNSIGGDTLEDLDKEDLREMGITPLGDVKRILKHAKKVDKREMSLKYHDFGVGSGISTQIMAMGCLKTHDIKKEDENIEIDLDKDPSRVQVLNPLYWGRKMSTQVEVEDSKEHITEMALQKQPTRAETDLPNEVITLAKDTGREPIQDKDMNDGTLREESVTLTGSMPVIVNVEGAHEMESDIELGIEVEEGCGIEVPEHSLSAICDDNHENMLLIQEMEVQHDDEEETDVANVDHDISMWMEDQGINDGNFEMNTDKQTYCLCNQVAHGDMIACDNDLCLIEWFHFDCMHLTSKPEGKWYCPKCKGDMDSTKSQEQFLKEGVSKTGQENKCEICNKIYTVKSSPKFPEDHEKCDSCIYRNYRLNQASWRDACKFACKLCPEKTLSRYAMIQHSMNKHKNKNGSVKHYKISERNEHECLLCKRYVTQESVTLKNHMLKSHKMNLATYERKHYLPSLKGEREQLNEVDNAEAIPRADFDMPKIDNNIGTLPEKEREVKDGDISSKKSGIDTEIRSRRRGNLLLHVKSVHQKIKDHACHLCDFKTSHKGTLRGHIKAVHKKIRDKACKLCKYKASNSHTLKKHVKEVHAKVKDYACDRCDYRASRPNLVRQHVKSIHDDIKDIMCDQCNFVTGYQLNLDYHMKHVHDPTKVIKCADCEYTNTHPRFLREHEIECHGAVDDEGFFVCDRCEYKAPNRLRMLRHKKAVHLMIKDQMCHMCDYVSSHKHNLKSHIKIIHENGKMLEDMSKQELARRAHLERNCKRIKQEPVPRKTVRVPLIKKTRSSNSMGSTGSTRSTRSSTRSSAVHIRDDKVVNKNTTGAKERDYEEKEEEEKSEESQETDMTEVDECDSDISDLSDIGCTLKSKKKVTKYKKTFETEDNTKKEDDQKECYICGKKGDVSFSKTNQCICDSCRQRNIRLSQSAWRNACKFACKYCPELMSPKWAMTSHLKTAHRKDGSARHYRLVERREHECLLCKRSVLQDPKTMNDHMLKNHNMNLSTYEDKHYFPILKSYA